jgi:hypothetical protein
MQHLGEHVEQVRIVIDDQHRSHLFHDRPLARTAS